MMSLSIQRKDLFFVMKEKFKENRSLQKQHVKDYILGRFSALNKDVEIEANIITQISAKISNFLSKLCLKWDPYHGRENDFCENNSSWLDTFEIFEGSSSPSSSPPTVGKRGRKAVSFSEAAPRTKNLRSSKLCSEQTVQSLCHATAKMLRSEGHTAAADLVTMLGENPNVANDILSIYKNSKEFSAPSKLTGEEATALIVHTDLSKTQFLEIRDKAAKHSAKIFPNYHKVLEAKKLCIPPNVFVTETCAEVPLQSLVDHNACRLVRLLEESEPFDNLEGSPVLELEMEHKWGVDGSSAHSEYQQMFETEGSSDRCVLLTAIVPLQLRCSSSGEVLWTNVAPSSTSLCQPIRLQFKKEEDYVTREEEEHISTQISNLVPTKGKTASGRDFVITHKFTLSMIDGKARAALSKTHSQKCCVCGATYTQMGFGHPQHLQVNVEIFKFGLSVLHARIRCLENVLNISYKLHLKVYRANESLWKGQKKITQERVKRLMGLSVDEVKQGAGNTNSGNTSRRFFANPALAAEATGVDEGIIERYGNILAALSCTESLDLSKFRDYCVETHQYYESKYPWYPMPPSIHLILVHGVDIMQCVDLPMGAYSEEALEALNKYIRHFRQNRTRKTSRLDNMTDLFNRLLLAGDIGLSRYRPKRSKSSSSLPEVVAQMLLS